MQGSKAINSENLSVGLTHIILVATTIALFFGFCPSTLEASPADHILRLGVSPKDWPPYIIVTKDNISGIAIDVLKNICSKKGFDLQIQLYPKKRGYLMLAEGKIDAWCDAIEWTHQPERYLWTEPIIYSEDLLIVRKDNPIAFNQVDDLFGKTIGTRFRYAYPGLDPHFNNGTIIRTDTRSNIALLKMVHMDRTDAGVINKWVALWTLKHDQQLHFTDFTFLKRTVGRAGYCVLFTRRHDWAPFIEIFNTELGEMKQDGRFLKLTSKYR